MNNSRRNFIKQAGLGITAACISPSLFSCVTNNKKGNSPFENIGIQLFTLRNELAKNPIETLKKVAQIGYGHVETFGIDLDKKEFWGVPVATLKQTLQELKLLSHSGHYDLAGYLNNEPKDADIIAKYIDVAKELGQEYIVAPVPPMENLNGLTSADYQKYADQLNKAG